MKRLKPWSVLLLFVMLGWGLRAPAQTPADVRLGELLNSGELFQLRDEYPRLKDSVSIRMLDLLARSQLGVGFNRPEEAAPALDSLLRFHQEELGAEATFSMASLRAMNLLNLGLYAAAGAAAGDLVRVLKQSLPFESYFGLVFVERIGKALADVPAPGLERPDRTVTVPLKYEAVGRGHHYSMPVEVNGHVRDFIFDTGCSFGCFVSERYAEEVGLKVVAASWSAAIPTFWSHRPTRRSMPSLRSTALSAATCSGPSGRSSSTTRRACSASLRSRPKGSPTCTFRATSRACGLNMPAAPWN